MTQLRFYSVLLQTLIVLIFLLSFRAFAGFLAPDFDSDQAVHVMMAYDLQLPEDLYYWGQNRLGSLLPIVSHGLLKISSLTPLEAVSYAQYGFLIIGYLCFASLFRKPISKVIFTLVWFLPPVPFLKLVAVAHPYAPQFALLGIALVATNRFLNFPESNLIQKLSLSLVIITSLVLSIWVADLSLVPAMVAIAFLGKTSLDHYKKNNQIILFFRYKLTYVSILIALLLSSIFLICAKSTATQRDQNYETLNDLGIIAHILRSIVHAIVDTFLFQAGNPFLSLYAISVLFLGCILARYTLKMRLSEGFTRQLGWIAFFLISAIVTFSLILLSHWTFIQETPPRYFIGIYVFCWLSMLLVFDNLEKTKLVSQIVLRRLTVLIVMTAVLGSLSLPDYVFALEKPESRLSMLQPIASLGKTGFIGEYWAAYLMCIVAPEHTSCTPHDQSFVRCHRCMQAALAAPVIYLVDRDWLESFPEEIEQFGQRLKRLSPAQEIAGYRMAPYRNLSRLDR
ncbi:MAG: hypothetical protein MUC48_21660 [Leptolyngbya sp. Prado105]|jgi:hypothetical protein|nr:hypothetical protein [Leptolyngbya sp. Prado105]